MKKILALAVAIGLSYVLFVSILIAATTANAADTTPTVNHSLMVVETTNSTGYIYVTLSSDFDEVQVTAAQPQAGAHGIVSVTATRLGTAKARFRVWSVGPGHTVIPDVGQEVILYVTTVSHA